MQKKFYPELFSKIDAVNDPRNSSYIDYPNRTMLSTLYFKALGSVSSSFAFLCLLWHVEKE